MSIAVAFGCEIGVEVGSDVGVAVGASVGVAVGSVVDVGSGLGVFVGSGVAVAVGSGTGADVGSGVGLLVGSTAATEAGVGTSSGSDDWPQATSRMTSEAPTAANHSRAFIGPRPPRTGSPCCRWSYPVCWRCGLRRGNGCSTIRGKGTIRRG